MNWVAWVLVGWGALGLVAGVWAAWFGRHLRRARHVWRRDGSGPAGRGHPFG